MCAVGSPSLEKPADQRFKNRWGITIIGVPLVLYAFYLSTLPNPKRADEGKPANEEKF
jgi:hypothetical protein